MDLIERETDFFSQRAFSRDRRESLLSLVQSVGAYPPENGSSDDDSIFSNDTDPEDSIDTLLDDLLQAYVECLNKLRLSLERPAPDRARPYSLVPTNFGPSSSQS